MSSYLVMAPGEVARLIDTYSAPLVLYARQWCDAPEDVVQEAFIKLVRQSRPPEDTVAWLYRVVRNGALDDAKMARRRQRRESAAARPVRWFVEPEVDGLDAQTAVAALERLAPEQREVIVAHHWGGLSFEQIAAVAGCSASTAFRRYTAGVDNLRDQLGVICPNRSSKD
ncbi:MAG TPA: sigma-70 family RNA polymerase sigma factor [Isosphaeraceae bacterium]|nr:sigma-70 family RNA polymerase sigma factor [Isosphaeraceae bacterium]